LESRIEAGEKTDFSERDLARKGFIITLIRNKSRKYASKFNG